MNERRRQEDMRIHQLQVDVASLHKGQAAMMATVEGLAESVSKHEQDDIRRFEGLYELTTALGQKMVKQEVYDEQHTELLAAITGKLDTVAQAQQSIADLPKMLKWAAGIVGSLVVLSKFLPNL